MLVVRALSALFQTHLPCGVGSATIPLDGIVPHSQTREDVTHHVQGMGRLGGDVAVVPCGRQSALGKSREVVRVNDIVMGTGMIRIGFQDAFGNRAGRVLDRIALVVGIRRC